MEAGFMTRVYRNDLELFVEVAGQPANRLYPETKTLFSVKEFPAKAEFVPGDTMRIILSRDNESFKGKKVK